MSKENRQRIFDYLMKEARESGIADVREAANLFLKTGIKMRPDEVERRVQVPPAMVRIAWQRQGGRCNICHNPLALDESAGDHIVPYIGGGPLKQSNIAAVHGAKSEVNCNSVKSDNDLLKESKRSGNLFNEMIPGE